MRPISEAERRNRARAVRAYSGLKQGEFAAAAGYSKDRFRAAVQRTPTSRRNPPSMDELLDYARAAGVPESFAIYGWRARTPRSVNGLEELSTPLLEAPLAVRPKVPRPALAIAGKTGSRRHRQQRPGDEKHDAVGPRRVVGSSSHSPF